MSEIKITDAVRISEQNALIAFHQQRGLVLAQLVTNLTQELEALRARVQELDATRKADREEIENLRIELAEKDA